MSRNGKDSWILRFEKEFGISFDDVLIVPRKSDIVPSDCDTRSYFSRNVGVKIPIASAGMDTVTESRLSIALARAGGIGIIHRNLTTEQQAKEVGEVKRNQPIVIENPVCVSEDMKISEFYKWRDKKGIHYKSFPVIDRDGKLKGFMTKLNFAHASPDQRICDVMLKPERFLVGKYSEWLGEPDKVYEHLCEHLSGGYPDKFVLTDANGEPRWMYDMDNLKSMKSKSFSANVDKSGKLVVGAAIGVNDYNRANALVEAGVDVIVVDSAHGHSKNVIKTVKELKRKYNVDIVAGNVATYEGACELAKAGVDGIKVGIGPGSICTTRVIAGVGIPQITAIMKCAAIANKYGIPLIADGGIRDKTSNIRKVFAEDGYKNSGDIVKAIAAGAHCVMLGNILAGVEESPSERVNIDGRVYKRYRGMGSEGALKERQAADRYKQKTADKFVPEGVAGLVPYKGLAKDLLYQLVGGLKSGMGYAGAKNINELRENSQFIVISKAAIRESHPHSLKMVEGGSNYYGRR